MKFKLLIYLPVSTLIILTCCAYSNATGMTIENEVFNTPQRPAVAFEHDDHNEVAQLEDDCSICHHSYNGKQRVKDESSEDSPCSDCHTIKPTAKNSIPLKTAFHNRCKACHFKASKGPVLCGNCHINKKRRL